MTCYVSQQIDQYSDDPLEAQEIAIEEEAVQRTGESFKKLEKALIGLGDDLLKAVMFEVIADELEYALIDEHSECIRREIEDQQEAWAVDQAEAC
ncbi:hypothetical protein [Endozoicomonas sp. Mp262]|uniref:hypothetical protein n=1 Tax=Endozoicomonas sp. Mp262 TaxID=2919499 RepID=UPI0021D89914